MEISTFSVDMLSVRLGHDGGMAGERKGIA